MRFISWNVNGLRACVNKGFADYFRQGDADFFCLQETKLQPHQIQPAVPHTAAAPCEPKAGVGVGDPGAPCKDTALPHAVTPPLRSV